LARGILYQRADFIDGLSMLAPAVVTRDADRDTPPLTVIVEDPGVMDSLSDDEREMMEIVVVRSKNYPRATYIVFDRAGHLLEEKDPLIGFLLNEWLDRVEEAILA
jgi:hypothetical protein